MAPGDKAIYFSHETTEDLFFTVSLDEDILITSNLARHFQINFYLRKKGNPEVIKKIHPNERDGFEVYH